MKRFVIFAALFAIMAVPGTAMAAPGDQRDNARGNDRSEQGKERSAQGRERAAEAKQRAAERRADRVNAARFCRAEAGETEATREAFREQYGTNENNANAFGKCVSTHDREGLPENGAEAQALRAEIQERKQAARTCAEERDEDSEAFAEAYGTNENNANAFGKCVSMEARAAKVERVTEARQERRGAARSCREDLREMGREDFREEYGNNRNGANAFGRCVSQTVRAESQDA